MIFHFKAAQNLVAEHEHYVRDFDMIFHYKEAQNFIAEHYVIDFDMIFHITAAQNMVEEHYQRDFDMIFHFKACRTLVQTGTAAEPCDASDQIRTDALCAHFMRRFRPEQELLIL